MTSWHSYPKVWNIGHPNTENLFSEPVIVEEKIDGSQFSFGKFNGELKVRSKGREFDVYDPDDMFRPACETVIRLKHDLVDGWTYRGETLKNPKHNTICYDRTPYHNIILFDIGVGPHAYLSREEKEAEAARLELEIVPILGSGMFTHVEQLTNLLQTQSVLGGALIEGFVVKNYKRFTLDGHALMAKHVSEMFKETHKKEWAKSNPSQGQVIQGLKTEYRSEARWQKAVQHLRDQGTLTNAPQDIPSLIKEVYFDIESECKEEIKEQLWSYFKKDILRHSTSGIAEWFKQKLLEGAFSKE